MSSFRLWGERSRSDIQKQVNNLAFVLILESPIFAERAEDGRVGR
jgi:hypothetical protein